MFAIVLIMDIITETSTEFFSKLNSVDSDDYKTQSDLAVTTLFDVVYKIIERVNDISLPLQKKDLYPLLSFLEPWIMFTYEQITLNVLPNDYEEYKFQLYPDYYIYAYRANYQFGIGEEFDEDELDRYVSKGIKNMTIYDKRILINNAILYSLEYNNENIIENVIKYFNLKNSVLFDEGTEDNLMEAVSHYGSIRSKDDYNIFLSLRGKKEFGRVIYGSLEG